MFCRYCGNEIEDDSVFCTKCGKKLVDEMSENIQENKVKLDDKKRIFIGVIITICIIIISFISLI